MVLGEEGVASQLLLVLLLLDTGGGVWREGRPMDEAL